MHGQGRPHFNIALVVLVFALPIGAQHWANGQGVEDSDHQRHMLEDAQLNDVAFVDSLHGWAVGTRGAIWHTADGGRSWQLQRSGVECVLESVSFVDQRTGWAVGGATELYSHRSRGVVLRTLDGGRLLPVH